jgi:hypothetical protein
MKLCIEGDIYFISKFHILETGTVKLSIETGLILLGSWKDLYVLSNTVLYGILYKSVALDAA